MAYPAVSAAYGMLPINLLGGRSYTAATRLIPIASGYGYNIGFGDLVTYASTGTIKRVDETFGAAKATFATPPVGIFLGCTYTDPNLKYVLHNQYWPASTVASDAYAIVCDDPDVVLKAALTNASGVIYTSGAATQAAVGNNIGYYVPTTYVNTATRDSVVSANFASVATTNTLPFTVLDVVKETALPDGTYSEVLLVFNAGFHFHRQATGI